MTALAVECSIWCDLQSLQDLLKEGKSIRVGGPMLVLKRADKNSSGLKVSFLNAAETSIHVSF